MRSGRLLIKLIAMALATLITVAAVGTETVVPAAQPPDPQVLSSSGRNLENQTSLVHSSRRLGIKLSDSLSPLEPAVSRSEMTEVSQDAEGNEAHQNASESAAEEPFFMPSWESWTSPERIVNSIRVVAIMAALSLAPALLLMTTCYVRLVVVLGLLRQALGSQQLPPQQVTTTLAMFLTALIMWPVWSQVHRDAIEPYSNPEISMSAEEAWSRAARPIRDFMIEQIRRAGNGPDVAMFLDYLQIEDISANAEIPLQALLPAFLISELKTAFLIGFQIYLPFLILDLVVSSVTMSMGMVMVPPSTIALPLKLIMFVLVDGWHLVVEMLLLSFAAN